MSAVDGSRHRLLQVAGWSVDPAVGIDPLPDGDDERRRRAGELVEDAVAERVTGPLLAAAEAGAVDLPGPLVDDLREAHQGALLWCLRLERRLLQVGEWFDADGGVEHLVVKGPAIAHLDEADPSRRTFADLDLLVRARDLDRAVGVLEAKGATRPWAQRRPGYDHRFAKSVTMTLPDGVEVDLHRSLCDGVHGFRIPLQDLFARPEPFDVGGRELLALAPVHRVLHAAYHAVLGSPEPKVMSLRDLAGYLSRPDLDPASVAPEAERWRGRAVLAEAVAMTEREVGVVAPGWERWLEGAEVDDRERSIVARQRREGSSLGPGKLQAMRELPRWTDRLAYGWALAVPSAEHLRSRGLRRRDTLRRGSGGAAEG